jgi:hypothetical protein
LATAYLLLDKDLSQNSLKSQALRRANSIATGATGTPPLEPLHLMPVIKLYLTGKIASISEIATIAK